MYIYIYISLCIYIYIKILGIGAELKNLCIKQQKNFVSLPTENLKTWVFDFRTPPKYIYEWALEYKVKKCLNKKKDKTESYLQKCV